MNCKYSFGCELCIHSQCHYLTLLNGSKLCLFDPADSFDLIVSFVSKVEGCELEPIYGRLSLLLSIGVLALVLLLFLIFWLWKKQQMMTFQLLDSRGLLRTRDIEVGNNHTAARLALNSPIVNENNAGTRLARFVRKSKTTTDLVETEF